MFKGQSEGSAGWLAGLSPSISKRASGTVLTQHVLLPGNYLILDGYGTVQESSTDEEVSSLVLQCTAGNSTTDSAHQQSALLRDAQSDRGSSPFAEELMASHWDAVEESCSDVLSPPFSVELRTQIIHYIQKIEADLEHLKVWRVCE